MKNWDVSTLLETTGLGEALGKILLPGDVIALIGPLGTGKTAFTGGVSKGVGLKPGFSVTSPTFVYAHVYEGRFPIYHMDFYRVENAKHLRNLGVDEMIGTDGAAVIEWFDLYPEVWKGDRLEIRFSFLNSEKRRLSIQAFGARPEMMLNQLGENA